LKPFFYQSLGLSSPFLHLQRKKIIRKLTVMSWI
jgi:hypothetical protein